MARNTILMANSCHPKHVTKNLPIGELIRVKRNCTLPEVFLEEQDNTFSRLRERAYPPWALDCARTKVRGIDRMTLLDSSHKSSKNKSGRRALRDTNKNPVTFSTIYSPQYRKITNIIKKHLPLLRGNRKMCTILDTGIRYVSRRAPTLGSIISPSLFTVETPSANWLSTRGFFGCGSARCTACKYAKNSQSVVSVSNGSTHQIRSYINCNSKYVIYVITCNICKIQYVGCTTTPLKVRIRRHLSDVRKPLAINISMVSRHFIQSHAGDTSSLSFVGLERIFKPVRGGDRRKTLLLRESMWILTLDTRIPRGLNIRQDTMLQY